MALLKGLQQVHMKVLKKSLSKVWQNTWKDQYEVQSHYNCTH